MKLNYQGLIIINKTNWEQSFNMQCLLQTLNVVWCKFIGSNWHLNVRFHLNHGMQANNGTILLKHFYCRLIQAHLVKLKLIGEGEGVCKLLQENAWATCLIATINRLPYLSKKTLQARICNPNETKKINGENERNKHLKLLSLHLLRDLKYFFLTPFWKHLQPYIENLDDNLEVTKQPPPRNKQQHTNIHKMFAFILLTHKHGSLQKCY